MKTLIKTELEAHLNVAQQMPTLVDDIQTVANFCINGLKNDGKLLIFGNGGSAADAQHIAAELVGRYKDC